jgi:hypothetical protein
MQKQSLNAVNPSQIVLGRKQILFTNVVMGQPPRLDSFIRGYNRSVYNAFLSYWCF